MRTAAVEIKSGYRLTLKGDGITVERNISELLAKEIIAMILGESVPQVSTKSSTNTALAQQSNGQQAVNFGAMRKSLREYFIEVGAKKNPQKILAIANYLVSFKGQTTFSIADIRPQFKAANEPIPANLHRDFQIVLQYGWIAPDHEEPKKFYITQTGLDALSDRFE